MNSNFLRTVSIATATALLVGCGGGGGTDPVTPPETSTQSQGTAPANKGPFALGSTVTAYKLNSDGSRGTETNTTKTIDNKGTFTISVPWEGPTELNIVGEYLNETTGTYMNDGDLSAIVDMKSTGNNSLGINIFTHMAVSVIRKKMADNVGADFTVLKEESKEVIADQFNLKLDADTALEDLDMTSSDEDANVQLLQISAALMNTSNPAETLANISEDLSDGKVDDEGQAALEELDEEMEKVDIIAVAQNIENNVEGSSAPQEFNVLNGTLAWDSNIAFSSLNDALLNTQQTSSVVTINGIIGDEANLTIVNGSYSLNGVVGSSLRLVRNGDQLALIGTSSTSYNSESEVVVTIGGEAIPFVIRTEADPHANDDAVPNEFDFGFKKNIAASTDVSSDEVVVSGINKATAISIVNGTFTVNGSSASEVNNGDKVVVTLTSGTLGETKKATVTIGGVEGKFVVSSEAKDSMPVINGLFQSVSGVDKATAIISNEIEVIDINVEIPVNISGGELSINGGEFTTVGKVSSGDKVKVRITSANAFDSKKELSLNVGTVVVPFIVQTKSDPVVPDKVPNSFSFNAQTTRVANTPIESQSITVSSINEAVAISIVDGKYSINGGAFTSEASTVNEGDKIVLQVLSADYGSSEKARVNIGGVSATFLVTTIKDDTLDSISFTAKENIGRNVSVESDIVTISGVNVPMPVSIVGGEYSIDGDEYVSSDGTVTEGQTLKVRVTSSSVPLASKSAVLSVGSLQLPFVVITQASIPPVSTTDTTETAEDTMVVIDVLLNDNDTDGDALSIVNLSTPAHGTAVVLDGKVNYTPSQDFVGVDTFSYQASDGMVMGSTVTVTVNVTPVNDTPVVEDKAVIVAEDSEQVITLTATDVDGDTPSFNIVTQPTHGSVTFNGALATYVPSENYVGADSFTYSASDASETSNTATINITVTNIGDAPVAVENKITTDKFTEITIDVLENDSDIDGDTLTISSVTTPNSGTATIVDNKILYIPSGDFNGTVNFSYVVSDGSLTSTANVIIDVTNVQSKLITAINILEGTNFETDDVASKLDEVKTTLNSADALDKDAKVGQAIFALAEITNSEEIGDLISITLDGTSLSYTDNLPAIVEGLSKEDSLEVGMVENITDMSAISTTVLHDFVLELQDIETALGESFADESYVFTYNDINLTANQSKLLRASILAVASKLEYSAAFNYLTQDDIEPKTITVDGVTAEYTNIGSNPIVILNRNDVGALNSATRLTASKNLLLSSIVLLNQVDASKESDSEDREAIEKAQSEASKVKGSLNGTAPYVIENDEEERVEKIYINLAALYNESSVLDMAHTIGHEFRYESNHDYFNGEEHTTGSYHLETSQFYNDAMSNQWVATGGTVIGYVDGQMQRPTVDIRPVVPMGTDTHVPLVVTKVEVVDSEASTTTYQGDELLRYLFNDIDLEDENNYYHYSNSEDINVTFKVENENMIPVDSESSYEFELIYAPSWLHLTQVDVDIASLTANEGYSGEACYTIRVSDEFGHSSERHECMYIDETFSSKIVGSTQYFVNSSGVKGYRVYADDNTYTGSITLPDNTVLDVSGTYSIADNVVSINRTSPNESSLTLTYEGDDLGGMVLTVNAEGEDSSTSISFTSASERDEYIASFQEQFFNRIVGSTQYFANSSGTIGHRFYADDNTYTGSITFTDDTVIDVSGTYSITDNVISINRTSPNESSLTLTYVGEESGGMVLTVNSGEEDSSTSISFTSENERDEYLSNLES